MDYNAFLRQWRKISQHAYIDLKTHVSVICKCCGLEFDGWDDDNRTQASGCAAMVYLTSDGETRVQGFYGSSVADMQVYRFIKNAPTLAAGERLDPVCDYCILTWMKNGDVEFVKESDPFTFEE